MTQIGFPLSRAHEALDEFLADPGGMARWIGEHDDENRPGNPDYGRVLAHIVGAEAWERVSNGYHQWHEALEVRDDFAGEPPAYRPWSYSPLATMDRLLPTAPLLPALAWAVHKKKLDDLTEDEQDVLTSHAIMCLLRVQLDPDGQGAVPILMVGHSEDEPGQALRWQIAFVTPVPGLYVRVTGNGFTGEEWGIVTGSGWKLSSGWYSRDQVLACVEALGRVLPNADWMRLEPSGYTDRAKAAIRSVLRRYRTFGIDEKQSEPEVMADAVPCDDVSLPAAEAVTTDA